MWLQVIIFVIFLLFPLISKIIGGDDAGNNQKPARRRPRPQRPVQQPQQGQPNAGGGKNALEREIEEFLHRSRGGKKSPQEPAPKTVDAGPVVRRLSDIPRSIKEQQASPQELRTQESVAEHVKRHIESDPISEHSRQLGKELGYSDESMEKHLQDVFDHDVGSIEHERISAGIREGTDAAVWETSESKRRKKSSIERQRTETIVEMLRKPETVQHAIILGEVMNRPNFD